jgi:hypothetical protein
MLSATLTEPIPAPAAADPPAGSITLWHRANGKAAWRRVALVATTRAALDLIDARGDWWVSEYGRTPAESAPPRC